METYEARSQSRILIIRKSQKENKNDFFQKSREITGKCSFKSNYGNLIKSIEVKGKWKDYNDSLYKWDFRMEKKRTNIWRQPIYSGHIPIGTEVEHAIIDYLPSKKAVVTHWPTLNLQELFQHCVIIDGWLEYLEKRRGGISQPLCTPWLPQLSTAENPGKYQQPLFWPILLWSPRKI